MGETEGGTGAPTAAAAAGGSSGWRGRLVAALLLVGGVASAAGVALSTIDDWGPANPGWRPALVGSLALPAGVYLWCVWDVFSVHRAWLARQRGRALRTLFRASVTLILVGVGLWAGDLPGWRWTTWFGLVAFTAGVVVRWWWVEAGARSTPAVPTGSQAPPLPGVVPGAAPASADGAAGAERAAHLRTGADPVPAADRANRIEQVFAWLAAYPLFPLQLVLFWTASWGGFAEGLGAPDLVWGDRGWMQFWVGVAVSMLFGNLLFVRALLDRRPGNDPPTFTGVRWSLFWFVHDEDSDRRPHAPRARAYPGAALVLLAEVVAIEALVSDRVRWVVTVPLMLAVVGLLVRWIVVLDRSSNPRATDEELRRGRFEVRRVGAFLLWTWLPALAVFYFPKMFAWEKWRRTETGWMPVGLATGVVFTLALTAVYEFRWRRWWTASLFFNSLPAFRDPSEATQRNRPLHALAGVKSALIPGMAAAVFFYEHTFFGAVWSPVWLLCLFLALFNSVYGFVTFHFAGLQYVLAVLVAAALFVSNTGNVYKMSHPGLETYARRAPHERVDLDGPAPPKPAFLIDTPDLLKAFHTKWAGVDEHSPAYPQRKPRLVIVATTGGGIQAAVWTAVVLEGLEGDPRLKAAGFRDHIRLMTGASGGMQAAALYAADFVGRKTQANAPYHKQLSRDSLCPTVQTMLVHDALGAAIPSRFGSDRGRRLEQTWELNCRAWADERGPCEPPNWFRQQFDPRFREQFEVPSPLARTFPTLAAEERVCACPSLVFSPMFVEDCRRLLVSNLSLDWFTTTAARGLNPPIPPEWRNVTDPDALSVPAVEFWRYFPDAREFFTVGTAARMSATFPFVGPAVSLPTRPPRRVVDAGYFDNFGINFTAMWLYHHRQQILDHTSGVLVVEIRAYPRREEKLRFEPAGADGRPQAESYNWAASEVTSPLEAIYNLYARGAYFRNDQLLHVLNETFNAGAPPARPRFAVVTFECIEPAALSWTLPEHNYKELKAIFGGAADLDGLSMSQAKRKKLVAAQNQRAETVEKVAKWFVDGTVDPK